MSSKNNSRKTERQTSPNKIFEAATENGKINAKRMKNIFLVF